MKIIVLCLAVFLRTIVCGENMMDASNDEEDVSMVFVGQEQALMKAIMKVEYYERVEYQTYLPYIVFNDRYTLDLYNFDQHIKSIDFDQNPFIKYYCPKDMFESLGLKGYLTPMLRTPDIFFCPTLKQSCCVNSDFEDLDTIWRSKYRNLIQYHQEYFKYYTLTVLENHEAIEEAAEKVLHAAKSETCRTVAQNILNTKINNSVIEKARDLLLKFQNFDMKLKRGFLCMLCDYENAKDMDFETHLLNFNHEICEQMVEHAFDFYHYFNNFVYKYINSANFIGYCYDEMDQDQIGKIKREEDISYIDIDNNQSNEICARAKQGGYNIFVNCLNFCNRYDLWYPNKPLYRDIDLLGKIFENIRIKIFGKILSHVVETPRIGQNIKVFQSKYDKFDIFHKWEFVFSDQTGIKFDHFIDMNFEDL